MVLCLGKPPGGFCDVGCCSFLFCDVACCSSFIAFRRHPSSFRELLPGSYIYILYFQSSSLQSDFRHFHFNFSGPFFHSFTVSTLVLSGHFFTYRCFLPYAPSPCLCHKLLSSRTPWEPAGFP